MKTRVSSKFKLPFKLLIKEPDDAPVIFRRGDVQSLLGDLEGFGENMVQKAISKNY